MWNLKKKKDTSELIYKTETKLFTKQKQIHRHTKQTYDYQRKRGSGKE